MMSREAVHTEIYKGYKINIFQDDDAANPQEDWDQAGTMICFHSRYMLGNKHNYKEPEDFIKELGGEEWAALDAEYDALICETFEGPDDTRKEREKRRAELNREFRQKELELALKNHLMFPLYLYDHSGISIRMGENGNPFMGRAQHAEWDSGQVGWIYISHENIKKEWGDPSLPENLELAKKCLKAETETFDDYLTGNVYGYVVSKNVSPPDTDEDDIEWEEIESCWGFYGDYVNYGKRSEDSYIMQEAKGVIDWQEKADLPLLAGAGLLKPDAEEANGKEKA